MARFYRSYLKVFLITVIGTIYVSFLLPHLIRYGDKSPSNLDSVQGALRTVLRARYFSESIAQRKAVLTRFCTSEGVKPEKHKWDFCLLST